jgi:hypothetical protein
MAQIKITITIEADLMRDAHAGLDAMDATLRKRGGRVVRGKLTPAKADAATVAPATYPDPAKQWEWTLDFYRLAEPHIGVTRIIVARTEADARGQLLASEGHTTIEIRRVRCGATALAKWTVLYTRIPTNYNPQCKLTIEAASAADARDIARDHLGDRGKALATYHIEDVKPFEPLDVAGRVIGGAL